MAVSGAFQLNLGVEYLLTSYSSHDRGSMRSNVQVFRSGKCSAGISSQKVACYGFCTGRLSRSFEMKCKAVKNAHVVELPDALLFDCDGVLVDTERDGHRVSFNAAFAEKRLPVEWDIELYGELLKIGGGKERMTHYFNKVGWPDAAPSEDADRKRFIADLHKRKTELFMDLVNSGALPLRPGVARLVDEALSNRIKVAVCSTSNEKAVSAIVSVMLGPAAAANIGIFAGDIVPKKKPDPAIYSLASSTLLVDPRKCIVVEDSHIGLTAAKAAGMACVITKSGYTAEEDFSAADAVFDCIGDSAEDGFSLSTLSHILAARLHPSTT